MYSSQARRKPDLGIWVIPGAIAGGVLGLLLALASIETVTSAPIPRGGAHVTASGRVFGFVVHEEIGPFPKVHASVGQHMRAYAVGMIVVAMIGGCLAALGLRALFQQKRPAIEDHSADLTP
jgi:hypothetical protein